MMGRQPQREAKLFYYDLCLETRIPQDHLLRRIQAAVDFDFTYGLVREHYGVKGNVSVPPPVLLKLMRPSFARVRWAPGRATNTIAWWTIAAAW